MNPEERQARRLRETAIHEAAHVVAYFALQRENHVLKVTIVPDQKHNNLGAVTVRTPRRPPKNMFDFGEIVICVAGGEASKRFLGRRNNLGASGDTHDLVTTMLFGGKRTTKDGDLVEAGYKPRNPQFFVRQIHKAAVVEANAILDEHWELVEAIADALIEKHTLKPRDLTKLWVEYWERDYQKTLLNRAMPGTP